MFESVLPPRPAAGAAIGRPARSSARTLSWAKRGVAFALVAAGALAMSSSLTSIVSGNAVMTAHRIALRAPIEGRVRTLAGSVGAIKAAGAVLVVIENELADERPLAEARQQRAFLSREVAAGQAEIAALRGALDELKARAVQHADATRRRLGLDALRAGHEREAKLVEARELERDAARKSRLSGVVPAADVERAGAASAVAAAQADALGAQQALTLSALEAARAGLIVEANSGNDVPYSLQRADDVRLRIIASERLLASLRARLDEDDARIAAEEAALARRRSASVAAPLDGKVWRVGAAAGERVAAGDALLELVDCRAGMLAVSVPQRRLPAIDMGGVVTWRLAGEEATRTGRIVASMGAEALAGDATLAAAPAPEREPTAGLVVAPDAAPAAGEGCAIGRTARVTLPALRASWLASAGDGIDGLRRLAGL